MMKKLLSRVLAAALVVGLLSVPSLAYEFPRESWMPWIRADTEPLGTAGTVEYSGWELTVYLFPAGTDFTAYLGIYSVATLDNSSYLYGPHEFSLPETGTYVITAMNEVASTTLVAVRASDGDPVDPEPEPEQPEQIFSDVPPTAWYAGFVQTVYEKGLFAGTGEGTFSPEANMTYAEFLTVLSQFSGDEIVPVTGGAWYETYVQWAQHLIPAGMAEDFNPTAPITRQDMAALFGTFLNAYDYSAETVNPGQSAYTDGDSVADYAVGGVELCYQLGIMSGGDDGSFAPEATATRAQVAVTMTQMARVMGR